jgi:hypothetical protein
LSWAKATIEKKKKNKSVIFIFIMSWLLFFDIRRYKKNHFPRDKKSPSKNLGFENRIMKKNYSPKNG